ncbi:hypothetical protein V6N11_025856 [Hibiscus sabdariffa]|uniref:Uncharacterized protein n=1 Tax=Hibiscus sabdariffa TaxID=183260 RepID=A0ABR2STX1_9ROSI
MMAAVNLNSVDDKIFDEVVVEVADKVTDEVVVKVVEEASSEMLTICDHPYAQKRCLPLEIYVWMKQNEEKVTNMYAELRNYVTSQFAELPNHVDSQFAEICKEMASLCQGFSTHTTND